MDNSIPLSWRLKKGFWARFQAFRFTHSKPQKFAPPKTNKKKIQMVQCKQSHPKIPLEKVMVFQRLPKEEAAIGMRVLVNAMVFLNGLLRPMKAGLPEIDADVNETLKFGLSSSYLKSFRAPVLPDTYIGAGKPELEDLAVQSPYSVLLQRGADGLVQWDFRSLGGFEHQEGLRSLGLRVVFSESSATRTLTATGIESSEYGAVHPGDLDWEASKTLAVCAATTHLSLTRHFNYVHLVSANHWDVATRNHLPTGHPVYRLLWPHIFNGLYSNYAVTKVQMLPDGDFVNMFSFTHDGLMKYFDEMYERYEIAITDPEADWVRRGLWGAKFDCPSHENLRDLFNVMFNHAKRYVYAYYESDEELQQDQAVAEWLEGLGALIPNGLTGTLGSGITRDGLARAVGATSMKATPFTTWLAPPCGTINCGLTGTQRGSTGMASGYRLMSSSASTTTTTPCRSHEPRCWPTTGISRWTPKARSSSPNSTRNAKRSKTGTIRPQRGRGAWSQRTLRLA